MTKPFFKDQDQDESSDEHKKEIHIDKPRTNWEIKVPQIHLIDQNGTFIGLTTVKEGVIKAKEANLDLVEIVPNHKPPVCKIMDLGKWIFEQKKKAKSNIHKAPPTHEIRLTPNTEQHDIEIKAKKAIEFLKEGSKIILQFKTKGREAKKQDLIEIVAVKFAKAVEEHAVMENTGECFILSPKHVEKHINK
jgi:translation initiation factor IF-3